MAEITLLPFDQTVSIIAIIDNGDNNATIIIDNIVSIIAIIDNGSISVSIIAIIDNGDNTILITDKRVSIIVIIDNGQTKDNIIIDIALVLSPLLIMEIKALVLFPLSITTVIITLFHYC